MSKPEEFAPYLAKAQALMTERMNDPKNIERPSILTKNFHDQNIELERAIRNLRRRIQEDLLDEAWIQAADLANLAWILVVTLENKQREEAEARELKEDSR